MTFYSKWHKTLDINVIIRRHYVSLVNHTRPKKSFSSGKSNLPRRMQWDWWNIFNFFSYGTNIYFSYFKESVSYDCVVVYGVLLFLTQTDFSFKLCFLFSGALFCGWLHCFFLVFLHRVIFLFFKFLWVVYHWLLWSGKLCDFWTVAMDISPWNINS